MKIEHELADNAAGLSQRAPNEWKNFLEVFGRYAADQKDKCVAASPEAVHVAQGGARQCSALLALFEDAVKSAGRIADRRELKRN